jgi:Raf kinase inhibitor-like YbhB/YbcL family protein
MIELHLTLFGLFAFCSVLLFNTITDGEAGFKLTSSAFADGKSISTKYANTGVTGGKNISPPLAWVNTPARTKSFALACVDRHPIAGNWVHWLVIDIPKEATSIAEGASKSKNMPKRSKELVNSFGTGGWGGPQPPPGSGSHKYEFILYALNVDALGLSANTSLTTFNKATEGKVIASARLVGVYER